MIISALWKSSSEYKYIIKEKRLRNNPDRDIAVWQVVTAGRSMKIASSLSMGASTLTTLNLWALVGVWLSGDPVVHLFALSSLSVPSFHPSMIDCPGEPVRLVSGEAFPVSALQLRWLVMDPATTTEHHRLNIIDGWFLFCFVLFLFCFFFQREITANQPTISNGLSESHTNYAFE